MPPTIKDTATDSTTETSSVTKDDPPKDSAATEPVQRGLTNRPAATVTAIKQLPIDCPEAKLGDKKYKLLTNCGDFAVGDVVTKEQIESRAYGKATLKDWLKSGIVASE